jgi:gamma-glutamyltranspeptidase
MTHYSIVDQFGATQVTTTLNAGFGSKFTVMNWVFTNNEWMISVQKPGTQYV